MEVILREDVPDLGMIGEVVKVKPGYARNFLFPRGIAVPADRRNLAQLEHERRLIEIKRQRERGTFERLADTLRAVRLEIEVRAGRGGKLFGSVTNQDVHRLLQEKGVEIDRRRIQLREPLREIGEHKVVVRVGHDIDATIAVSVRALGGVLEGADDEDEASKVAVAPAPEPGAE